MFRHDPTRIGLAAYSRSEQAAAIRWGDEPALDGVASLTRTRPSGEVLAVPVAATPFAVPGVGVVVAAYDGRVMLMDERLTKTYWTLRLPAPLYATPVADAARERVLTVTTSGVVSSIDLRGNEVWRRDLDHPVRAMPAVGVESLFIAAFGSRGLLLDVRDGKLRSEVALPSPWHAAVGGLTAHRDPYASPVALSNGDFLVACAEHLLRIRPDGSVAWSRELFHSVRASPLVTSDGVGLVCLVNGDVVAADLATGQVMTRLSAGGKVLASPALSGAIVAVGTTDGAVLAINTERMVPQWRSRYGGPSDHTSLTVTPAGDFVATAASGNVVCLDRSDGAIRWETSQVLGRPEVPTALNISPGVASNGRLYCGCYEGAVFSFAFRREA